MLTESEELGGLTQEEYLVSPKNLCGEDIMDNISVMGKDSDGEEDGHGWRAPKSKKAKKIKRVMMATRTSSRIPRDGIPIVTEAIQRAVARDNVSGNSFTVLNSTSTSSLQYVIHDMGLECEEMEEYLDVFKTEEVARAKIVEANYKSFLEKLKNKSAPQTEEEEQDFTMGVISNEHRGSVLILSRGEMMD